MSQHKTMSAGLLISAVGVVYGVGYATRTRVEFGGGRYRRDFTLSDAVDPDRIQARVKNGVLTVSIPKKDEVKARKIQVTG